MNIYQKKYLKYKQKYLKLKNMKGGINLSKGDKITLTEDIGTLKTGLTGIICEINEPDEDNEIFWPKQPHASWSKNTSTAAWDAPITYPSVTDDGQDPVVFTYMITWNEVGYQADNTKGWEATKHNVDGTDHADGDTISDWNGSAWVSR